MPPVSNYPCGEHMRRIEEAERRIVEHADRLTKGDTILKTVKRIESAVCGDPEMGVEGLASLPRRVQALERRHWWTLGAVAALSTGIPILLQLLGK